MKVMLVDDSTTMRNIQKKVLTRLGYTDIVEASDGKEALDKAKDGKPDLILLDWNMPELDGLGFLKAFRTDNKSVSVR